MTGPVDPGDPFTPGTLRFRARADLLRAIDALLDARCAAGSVQWAELFQAVRDARARWALYGRDGE